MEQKEQSGNHDAGFASALQRLVQQRLAPGARVSGLRPLTAGANKGTWAFDVEREAACEGYILQLAADSGAPDPDAQEQWIPHLDGTEEFRLMQAAQAAGVPVPSVRCMVAADDGLGGLGAITARIDGETLGVRVLREPQYAHARATMAAQCGRILAGIHRMPAASVPFLAHNGVDETLALYRRVLDSVDWPLPALELALRWGAAHRPRVVRRTVVHGDFRTGNFIVGPEGVRAVLDWEVAHTGDPIEDLGYLCMRTWRFGGAGPVGGFGRREELYAAYEAESGVPVEPGDVRFWEVMGSMRWALGCVRRALSFRHQGRRRLEFAGVGRRLEEPTLDILDIIEGRGP